MTEGPTNVPAIPLRRDGASYRPASQPPRSDGLRHQPQPQPAQPVQVPPRTSTPNPLHTEPTTTSSPSSPPGSWPRDASSSPPMHSRWLRGRRTSAGVPTPPPSTGKSEGYEVVEAEDEDDDVEEIPRSSTDIQPMTGSPEIYGRGSFSAMASMGRGSSPASRHMSSSDTASTNGPIHVRGRKEIPIPMRRSSRSAMSPSSPTPTPRLEGRPPPPPSSPPPVPPKDDATCDIPSQDIPAASAASASPSGPSPPSTPVIPVAATGGLRQETPKPDDPPVFIPKIPPIGSGLTPPINLRDLAAGLEDKCVDEFGNILDWDGQVLGRVEGDLPAMIGRSVRATGEIFGPDGEVAGYVVENDTLPPPPPPPQPIEGQMGGGLKVDHMGNILDASGNVIGHFNTAPLAPAMLPPNDRQQHEHRSSSPGASGNSSNASRPGTVPSQTCSCGHPKPSSTPSPSEVYLDVKSTNDGIQLIIKIPTVFNNGGRPQPTIHIGA